MKLTLGISPCPNDTFIFDALVNKKIDTGGLEIEVKLEDVETLNQWAFEGKLDITKISYPACFLNADKYVLLKTGGALGRGVGPLLISKQERTITREDVVHSSVALPGEYTTAHLLFSYAYPEARNKRFMIFSAIEDAVLNDEASLGVIIHENRFTYHKKGLFKVADLGEIWEKKLNLPVPLGGIAVRRTMDRLLSLQIEKLIRESLQFALTPADVLPDFVKQHAQEMSEEVMRQHIHLYVNDFTLDIGESGKRSVEAMSGIFSLLFPSHNPIPSSNGYFL